MNSSQAVSDVDWDNRYRSGWAYGKAPNEYLERIVRCLYPNGSSAAGKRVLSVGEGQGRNVAFLASIGFHCTAVDSSPVASAGTRRIAEQRGVAHLIETVIADATLYEPGADAFDLIISIFCMFPAARRESLHRRLRGSLRAGGVVIVECFGPGQLGINAANSNSGAVWGMGPAATCLVGIDELMCDFDGLAVLEAREIVRRLREGRFHRGEASCTQLVAKRVEPETYRAAVDLVFDEAACRQTDEAVPVAAPKGTDTLLANASFLLRAACEAAHPSVCCRYCWCPPKACICEYAFESIASIEIAESEQPVLHWAFLVHPNEFLRSTSSAKLAAQYLSSGLAKGNTSEFLVYGCRSHEARLDALMASGGGHVAVLYPPNDGSAGRSEGAALSVDQFLRLSTDRRKSLTIIVPDGSWANTAQLVRCLQAAAELPRVALDSTLVQSHHSPLIEALKTGQGLGRISTLEACALFCQEAGRMEQARHLLMRLTPLVDYVSHHISRPGNAVYESSEVGDATVAALQGVAAMEGTVGLPPALRRCALCGENLATPARMEQHLRGLKHCRAVYIRYLSVGNPLETIPGNDTVLSIWKDHCTNVLAEHAAEPPDVSLQRLKDAIAATFTAVSIMPKGERFLAASPQPLVVEELPDALRQRDRLLFEVGSYGLYPAIVSLLDRTTSLGHYPVGESKRLERFQPRADVFRNFKDRQVLYNAVCADQVFLAAYERLVKEVVCPYLKNRLVLISKADNAPIQFHYQYPPSVRVQAGNSEVFGRLHRDVEYGHQAGEINFWMPLTDFAETRTTLWAESAPGTADFAPLDVTYGEIAVFHGSLCHHFVPANKFPFTRISMDFRVGVDCYFDSEWELKGIRRQHGRRIFMW